MREFPTFWRGARVPQGALWINSEDTSAEVLEIPSSFLPVCCHLGIVSMSSKPVQLQLDHLCTGLQCSWWPGNGCSFTCLLHSLQDCFISSQLFQLCKFSPIMSLFLLAVNGSAALSRGTAGRSLSSQSASVSSSWIQQKPPLLPTEQHHPRAPSSLWTPERSGSWGWMLAQVPSITTQREPRWAVKLADDAALNSR